MKKKLLLAATVAWTAWALAGAVLRLTVPPEAAAQARRLPWQWHLGSPQVRALQGFLGEVDRRLPPGSVVAVGNAPLPDDQDFFLFMWCAYELPRHNVVRLKLPASRRLAQFVVAWHTSLEHRRLEPLFAGPEGTLYRVLPP